MKRIILLLIPLVLMLCSFTENAEIAPNENYCLQIRAKTPFYASSEYQFEEEIKKIEDELHALIPSDARDILTSLLGGEAETGRELLAEIIDGEIKRQVLLLIAVSLILTLAEGIADTLGVLSGGAMAALSLFRVLPFAVILSEAVRSVAGSLAVGSEFFSGLIPLLTALITLGGGLNLSSAAGAGMSVGLGFVSSFLGENLLPLAMAIFSLSLVSSFDTGGAVCALSGSFKSIFYYILGISSAVTVGILTLQTSFGAVSDSLVLRGAKYAVSGMLPVVGNMISGALGTLASGVRMLSKSFGTLSSAVIIIYMGSPILKLLIYRFAIGVSLSLSSTLGGRRSIRELESLRGALDCIIAVLASSALIYLFEIMIITKNLAEVMV